MGITDAEKIRALQDRFRLVYGSLLKQEGFHLAVGIGKGCMDERGSYTLEVRLTPTNSDLGTVTDELKRHIETEVLPADYGGAPVRVRYMVATARPG